MRKVPYFRAKRGLWLFEAALCNEASGLSQKTQRCLEGLAGVENASQKKYDCLCGSKVRSQILVSDTTAMSDELMRAARRLRQKKVSLLKAARYTVRESQDFLKKTQAPEPAPAPAGIGLTTSSIEDRPIVARNTTEALARNLETFGARALYTRYTSIWKEFDELRQESEKSLAENREKLKSGGLSLAEGSNASTPTTDGAATEELSDEEWCAMQEETPEGFDASKGVNPGVGDIGVGGPGEEEFFDPAGQSFEEDEFPSTEGDPITVTQNDESDAPPPPPEQATSEEENEGGDV